MTMNVQERQKIHHVADSDRTHKQTKIRANDKKDLSIFFGEFFSIYFFSQNFVEKFSFIAASISQLKNIC